jgi:methyl-accepting chemotaxis protein
MKIKKFNENEIQNISSERVDEITESLTELSKQIEQKNEMIDSLINELNNYQTQSRTKNDQIDDSISNLQLVRGLFSDSIDKVDNVVISMKDYNKSGRNFLY